METTVIGIDDVTVISLNIIRRVKVHEGRWPISKHVQQFTGITVLDADTSKAFNNLLQSSREVVPTVHSRLSILPCV